MMLLPSYLVTCLLASTASAWNTDVHQQIGHMAEQFLTPSAMNMYKKILEPQYNGSIGLAAAWADGYAHTKEGAFSYQWHWIDSSDNPPINCKVDYTEDCSPGGCVVSAIANQTSILKDCINRAKSGDLENGVDINCSYALKWVAHFVGDIAQPLHASGIAAGGNFFPVVYDNIITELHAVWDGYIIYTDSGVKEFPNATLQPFFADLITRIRSDDFSVPTSEWISCSDPATPVECAFAWARDSNSWTCEYVYKHNINDTDLATSGYATGAFPIVELQVSKAALRLGTWLNRLVDETAVVSQAGKGWDEL